MAQTESRRTPALHWMSRTALALAIGTLVACGGGGGGGGIAAPTVTVPTGARAATASGGSDVNAANYATLAAPVVRAVANSATDSLLDLTQGADREQAQVARAGSGGGASPMLLSRIATLAMRAPMRERAAEVITPPPEPCVGGGSLSISINDADNSNTLSAQDGISLTANNCVAVAGQPAANGSFSMTINAVELNADDEPTALDVTAQFNAFQVTGYGSMTGGFRLWAKSTDASNGVARVSYLATQVTEAATQVTYDFDVYTATRAGVPTFEMSGGIGIGGNTYAIELNNAFVGTPPAVGALRLKDAAGDFAKLVAKTATTFDLEYYNAIDTATPAAAQRDLLWSAYRQ